jgi:hypothetical protein
VLGRLALAFLPAFIAVAMCSPFSAAGAVRSPRLIVERSPGADRCPSPDEVRQEVVRRLGTDPFSEDGALEVRCTIAVDADGLHALIAVAGPERRPAERRLSSPQRDCRELADAIELALAIAVDPRVALRRPPASVSQPSVPESPDVAVPSSAAPVPAPRPETPTPRPPDASAVVATIERPSQALVAARSARELWLGIELLGIAGLVPGPTAGVGVSASFRAERSALELDLRATAPGSVDVEGGSVSAWAGTLAVAPCALRRSGELAACLVGRGGIVRGHGQDFALRHRATLPYVATGLRLALQRSFAAHAWFGAGLDVDVVLVRAHLDVDGVNAWTASRVNAQVGLRGGWHFP